MASMRKTTRQNTGTALRGRAIITVITLFAAALSFLIISPSFYARTHAASPSASPGGWFTYGFNPGRTGYNSSETIINPNSAGSIKLLWSVKTGSIISVQPIVANGLIYWGSWDGIFHATRPDGTQAWTANLGRTPTPSACSGREHGVMGAATFAFVKINSVSIPVIFVGGGKDVFYALNAKTGSILWQDALSSPPTELWSSSAIYKGSVYITTSSWGDCPLVQAQIFRLNPATGAIENTYNVVPNGCNGASVWGSVAIDTTNSTLYFATGNGGSCSQNETNATAIVKLNASNLSFIASWQVPASQLGQDSDFGNTPTIFTATIGGSTHRLVGVANKNGVYYALDEANFAQGPVWQDTIAMAGQDPEAGQGSISPSAWDGNHLYLGSGNTTINGGFCQGAVRAVNPATGAFIWQTCLNEGPVIGAVTVVPGVVVVGEGNVLALMNASNGKVLAKQFDSGTSSNKYYGGPSIFNGVVYIGNEDGNFYAYGNASQSTPTPPPSPTILPTSTPGTIIAQDTFQRANRSLWGTASDGKVWGADANTQSVFSIVGHTGQISNGNNIYNAVLGPAIGNSEVLFSGAINSFNNSNFGAVLRWADANNLYKGYIDGSSLIIQKRVNGVSTIIGSTPFGATAGKSYTIRFRIVGSTLYIKAWQTSMQEPANWMVTATDSTFSSGFCGLRTQIQGGTILNITSFQATAE